MGRSTRFPNLQEFRARMTRLGHTPGAAPDQSLPQPRRGGVPIPWMWLGIGGAAAVSLGWLAFGHQPDSRRAAIAETAPQVAAPSTTGPTETRPNRWERDALEKRLAEIEQMLREQREAPPPPVNLREFEDRLRAIEQAFGPITGSIGPSDVRTRRPAARQVTPLPSAAPLPSASPLPPRLASTPYDALGRPATPTAAPPRRQTAARPAELPAASGALTRTGLQFGVDLGGFRTLDALEDSWARLAVEFPQILGGLTPRKVTRVEASGGHSYRLIAGPFADITDTARTCDALRTRGVACAQAVHVGEPLLR